MNQKITAIYNFIETHIHTHGYAPSIREIAAGVPISSTSVVHYHLKQLQAHGLIHRRFNAARALTLSSPVVASAKPSTLGQRPPTTQETAP